MPASPTGRSIVNSSPDSTQTGASGSFLSAVDSSGGANGGLHLPPLSLPKSGGALRGIDESFQVNAANGTLSFGIPIPLAPGRGFAPALSLQYSSGAGNGPFGIGWRLAMTTLQRQTDRRLPEYRDADESDVFALAGAEELIPALRQQGNAWIAEEETTPTGEQVKRYRPRIDSTFARIERITPAGATTFYWRVTTGANIVTIYGRSAESRIADPADARRIFCWLPDLSYDDKGHCLVFQYKAEDLANVPRTLAEEHRFDGTAPFTNRYLRRVRYGNRTPYRVGPNEYAPVVPDDADPFLFETVFDYGEYDADQPHPDQQPQRWPARRDAFSDYRAGFEQRTYRRCQRVLLFHSFDELGNAPCLVRSLDLTYRDTNPALEAQPLEVTYLHELTPAGYVRRADGSYSRRTVPPLTFRYAGVSWNQEVRQVLRSQLPNAPQGLSGPYQWIDLDSQGLPGLLTEQGGAWWYEANEGNGQFAPGRLVAAKPSLSGLGQVVIVQDLEANGQKHVVSFQRDGAGYFEPDEEGSWQPFRPFPQWPNVNLGDPNLRLIDLTGDGRPDLLITEEEAFVWYESKGKEGYHAALLSDKPHNEAYGPALVFADSELTIYLADMTGDGLTDIVRIRNGSVCYWPNLGYGRFGAQVTMTNAPVFDRPGAFNPGLLRLADVSGTGATDLLYLGGEQPRAWLNLSGNAFSQPTPLPALPMPHRPNVVDVLDLLGTGTACLVWSSPLPTEAHAPLRYVDLMNGQKPHLLTGYENNCGKEVAFTYRPSPHFCADDRRAGIAWQTHLPFAVQCLHTVRTTDHLREVVFQQSYRYRHGYFDPIEREFRGFGWTEQLDTETFGHFQLNAARNVVEAQFHQPPVRTVSWFHLGAFFDRTRILHQFKNEYFQNTAFAEFSPAEPSLPTDLSAEEAIEALRAYRGLPLRQEVYADDNRPESQFPYSTTGHTYEIRRVQARGTGQHAAFRIVPAESISNAYERNPADPRTTHTLTLTTDDLGFVTQAASVVYPRWQRPAPGTPDAVPDEVWQEQNRRHIVYAETRYTNDVSSPASYRLRTVCETQAYELLLPGDPRTQFTRASLLTQASTAAPLPFETEANGTAQKRLTAHTRHYFRADDLQNRLPLGQLSGLGISFETCQLAFTPGLIAQHYTGKVDDVLLADAGYVHAPDPDGVADAGWWAASGQILFGPNAADHFYRGSGSRDALGVESQILFDPYDLLPIRHTDALGNTQTMVNDYRTLSAREVTDANGNRSAVETDELGMAVRTALMGKTGAGEGDTLADPTNRIEYDWFQFMNHRRPNVARTFQREQHGPSNPRWQETVAYYDGNGGLLMSKVQAEPGVACRWDETLQQVVEEQANPRWVGSGRTILNNKGYPIKQYEPYFSGTDAYETARELVETGPTSLAYFDPLGRNLRTELPNGTLIRLEHTSWLMRGFDTNDTVRDTDCRWYADRNSPDPTSPEPADAEQRAAWLTARHANTPGIVHKDNLGRTLCTVSYQDSNRTTYVRTLTDPAGRFSRTFDQAGREILFGATNLLGMGVYGESAERGRQWLFSDVLGNLRFAWENDQRTLRNTYDRLHRPRYVYLTESGAETLVVANVYGEEHPDGAALNLLGRMCMAFDQAGVIITDRIDFKGNPLSITRRFTHNYRELINWAILEDQPDTTAILNTAGSLLRNEAFIAQSTHDALNRPERVILPDGSIQEPTYNEANGLDSLRMQVRGRGAFIPFLKAQDYDAKGQRQKARFGNDVVTRYVYDPFSFRLTRLLTKRTDADPDTASLQDLRYTYDPTGNVVQTSDESQQTHFFRNAVVRPESRFEYDARYQVIRATGREHAGAQQSTASDLPLLSPLPHPNQAGAVRVYTETYRYDDLDNLKEVRHLAGAAGNWTRAYRYQYESDAANCTNRLAATTRPGDAPGTLSDSAYAYDVHGNMTRMPHLNQMVWNYIDQLREVDLGNAGRGYYVYGAGGHRVRKITEGPGGRVSERIYLGVNEIYREYQGTPGATPPRLERWTLHVSDNVGEIAQVDTKTVDLDNTDPANAPDVPLIRYRHSNLLNSATLEVDEGGNVISYEEFHPFGTSAYRLGPSVSGLSQKRYRFMGRERDEETGLYCMGVRYYAPWLGRWTSSDPAGFVDGFNLYRYCRNRPTCLHDPDGTDPPGRFTLPLSADVDQYRVQHSDVAGEAIETDIESRTHTINGRYYRFEGHLDWTADADGSNGRWFYSATSWTEVDPANGSALDSGAVEGATPGTGFVGGDGNEDGARPGGTPDTPAGGQNVGTAGGSADGSTIGSPTGDSAGLSAGDPAGSPAGGRSSSGSSESPEDTGDGSGRSFWSRGGTTLILGGIALVIGAILLVSNPVGWFALASATMLYLGGLTVAAASIALLTASYAGFTTAEEDQRATEALNLGLLLSSPAGAVGGAIGGMVNGYEGMYTGATVGSVVQGVYGLGQLSLRGARMLALRSARRSGWTYNQALAGTGTRGKTSPLGEISIRPGLSGVNLVETLAHEGTHRLLSPLYGPMWLRTIRADFGTWGYFNSHLLRFVEEGLAQSVATTSYTRGFSWIYQMRQLPLGAGGYGISMPRVFLELGGYLGATGAAGYGASQLVDTPPSPPPTSNPSP